jgi:hypothetical protein
MVEKDNKMHVTTIGYYSFEYFARFLYLTFVNCIQSENSLNFGVSTVKQFIRNIHSYAYFPRERGWVVPYLYLTPTIKHCSVYLNECIVLQPGNLISPQIQNLQSKR